ncbi:hypothetical protein B0T18DRAFT_23138 [Schizothecium vesticola]|uniref:Uncharacterized protein n=1 Tax=Schizothecium vesticola TaxID=314040 RepID=A0AA40F9Q8_9PEZI|nr:hypothetical protein B0T18DRAFT_23138 [Schizothecium vesticola]
MLDDGNQKAIRGCMAASVVCGLDGCREKCRCDEVESGASLEIGRPSLRSRIFRGRTGVPAWGSGLKACGGGASTWQKDPPSPSSILINRSWEAGAWTHYLVERTSARIQVWTFCSSTQDISFSSDSRAPCTHGGVEPMRRPRLVNPRIHGLKRCEVSTFQLPSSSPRPHVNTPQALRHPVGRLAIACMCCQATIAASTIQRPGRAHEQGLMDGVVVVALDGRDHCCDRTRAGLIRHGP